MLDLQKTSIWKRAGALFLDAVLTVVLTTGFMLLLFALVGYDSYADESDAMMAEYGERYGLDLTQNYDTLTDEEKIIFEKANEEWKADEKAQHIQMVQFKLTIFATSLSVFLSFLALGFAVPLLFGNGQTVGKKIFGLGVIYRGGIRLRGPGLFVRTILGKYSIETMVPILLIFFIEAGFLGFTGALVLFGILILQLILFFTTPANGLIHDALAGTAVVDLSTQRIFETEEELIAYKEALHQAEAQGSDD